MTRIALIHATPVSIDPIKTAFDRLWPQPELVNILDDSLSGDRAKSAELTDATTRRIVALAEYGASLEATAVLFTCSAFGPAIEEAARRLSIPVLKPNEAMFEEALRFGDRIGMIATFGPSVASMEAEFADDARRIKPDAKLLTVLCKDARVALESGDVDAHNRIIADQARAMKDADAIMLAHFSTARALDAARDAASAPVLSSPEAAVRKVRRLIERSGRKD